MAFLLSLSLRCYDLEHMYSISLYLKLTCLVVKVGATLLLFRYEKKGCEYGSVRVGIQTNSNSSVEGG